jgi:hypothetical protein
VGKQTIGELGTRIAFYFYITNGFFNAYLIRAFSNSVETILHIIIFHYFLKITHKYDINIKLSAFLISIALVIRNTSIIGWIPLFILHFIIK